MGAILLFDLTDDVSFINASKWISEIQKYTEEGIIINLIGNKYDLIDVDPDKRKVTEVEVGQFCNKEYLLFSEVSAKTGYNVRECFENFIESKRIVFFLLFKFSKIFFLLFKFIFEIRDLCRK